MRAVVAVLLAISPFLSGAASAEVHRINLNSATYDGDVDVEFFRQTGKAVHKTIQAGDTVQICNHAGLHFKLLSFSPYNRFSLWGPGSSRDAGERSLAPGKCIRLKARNPTDKPILWRIHDETKTHFEIGLQVLPLEGEEDPETLRTDQDTVRGKYPKGCAETFENSLLAAEHDNGEISCACKPGYRWNGSFSGCNDQANWPDEGTTALIYGQWNVSCTVPWGDDMVEFRLAGKTHFTVDDAGRAGDHMLWEVSSTVHKGQTRTAYPETKKAASGSVAKDGTVAVEAELGQQGTLQFKGRVILHPAYRTYQGNGLVVPALGDTDGGECSGKWTTASQ